MPRLYGNYPFIPNNYQESPEFKGPFGETRTVSRTPQFDIKPFYGTNTLRDRTTLNASATISSSATGELQMTTAALANSSAILQTRDYGFYQIGFGSEASIGIRIPVAMTGTQQARWGYYDGTNGIYFQSDATNTLSINLLKAGTVVSTIIQSNFNQDKGDGSGPSGYTIDLARGNVFKISYTWYGYGPILFQIWATDADGSLSLITLHSIVQTGTTNMNTPALPIRADLINNATATATNMFIGGRGYCIVGRYKPKSRMTTLIDDVSTPSTTTAFAIVMGIRKKTGFQSVRCILRRIELFMNQRVGLFLILLNPTITGGTWVNPLYISAADTCLEYNTGATAYSGGSTIFSSYLDNSLFTRITLSEDDEITLTSQDTLALVVKTYGGNGTLTYSGLMFSEDW